MTEVRGDGRLTRIELAGRLDTPGVDRIATRFHALVAERERDAIVDLSQVEFISSTGIGMLVLAARSLDAAGRKLVLLCPHGVVSEYLEAAAVYHLIPVARSAEEAMALCAGA